MLQTEGLSCERNGRVLFERISFDLGPGELLKGERANGAGKTMLLRILCGLYEDYEGEVRWDLPDYPIYMGHKPGVKDHLTARENLTWLNGLGGGGTELMSVDNALLEVGLNGFEDVLCGAMSQGQRKRVSLARLCMIESPAWILDEPFSSIDAEGIEFLETLMQQQLENGRLVLLSSHQTLSIRANVKAVRLSGA